MRILITLIMAAAIIGCGKADSTQAPAAQENAKAAEAKPKLQPTQFTAQQVVEGMAGKTAVDQGRKAQDKIKAVSASENKNLNEVFDGK